MKRFLAIIALMLALSGDAACQEPASFKALPVNQWSKLPALIANPYVYSRPLYVPSRKQVLHWGAVASPSTPGNDVRAFDAAAGKWTSDYPTAQLEELSKALSANLGIQTKGGKGAMLATGTPAPSYVVNAVCYDSQRDRLVYVLKGLMAAYDPVAKKWHDLKAEAELAGQLAHWPDSPYALYERGLRPEKEFKAERIPGGPPVYGAGVCYDPVNDEIILFPHWGGQNTDRRPATGQVSSHTGTWRYRFNDNVWRRVGHTLGSPEVQASRQKIIGLMSKVSQSLDTAWHLQRHPDAARETEVGRTLQATTTDAEKLAETFPAGVRAAFGPVPPALAAASKAAAAGKLDEVQRAGAVALRHLETLLDQFLRVEPPPRCAAPMVYDSKNKVVILFGGQNGLMRTDLENRGRDPESGSLNDTWLYDVTTRQWREVPCRNRPPTQGQPMLVFDEASGLALLVTRGLNDKKERVIRLWSFDADKGEWSKRHEELWQAEVRAGAGLAFDASRRQLVLTQGQDTFVFPLDLGKLPATPALEYTPPTAIALQVMPADDPEWVAKLKALPANHWVHPRPQRDAETRDWGVAACDAARGWVYYFGGGHSTYQVNDVAVYAVGTNHWVHGAGDHNDWVPPVHWDGITMGMRGGPPAGHQRNSYVAIDGRLLVTASFHSRRWDAEVAKEPGTRISWFYDLNRGGVWRQRPILDVDLGPGVPGTYGRAHLADPSGKVFGFAGHLEPYDGRFFNNEAYFSTYDIYTNKLSVRKIPPPTPGWVGEGRPFCYLPDKNQIFFYEQRPDGGHTTWIYDVQENRFTDLKPKRQPPADPRTVEYLVGQDAVFAIIGKGEPWVYSFKHNTWAALPLASDGPIGFASPYAQMVYVAKYGVLVNTGSASRGLAVMRPDVSVLKWD